MRKLLIILYLLVPFSIYAQTDREMLVEIVKQQAETNKQITELTKQQAITATKLDSFEKSTEKHLETQSSFMIVIMGLVGGLKCLWSAKPTNG